jgi:hypothetical protein
MYADRAKAEGGATMDASRSTAGGVLEEGAVRRVTMGQELQEDRITVRLEEDLLAM